MTWTQFMDMHSGGGQKEAFAYCYIEAPEAEAANVFYHRFGHNPHRVSCTCCGNDYSLTESPTLEQATAYNRNCRYIEDERGWHYGNRPADFREGRYIEADEEIPPGYKLSNLSRYHTETTPLAEYLKQPSVLVIRAEDIKPQERVGDLPEQGYVWVD